MDSFAPSSFYLICSPINFRLASFSPCSSLLTPVWPPLPCASCRGFQNLTSDLGAGTAEDGARAVEAALLPLLVAGAGHKVRQGAGLRPLGGDAARWPAAAGQRRGPALGRQAEAGWPRSAEQRRRAGLGRQEEAGSRDAACRSNGRGSDGGDGSRVRDMEAGSEPSIQVKKKTCRICESVK